MTICAVGLKNPQQRYDLNCNLGKGKIFTFMVIQLLVSVSVPDSDLQTHSSNQQQLYKKFFSVALYELSDEYTLTDQRKQQSITFFHN